jgi:nitroimidazol reductase NimA-like FMN-containing flavoprotein (pyridoxamine 5'-phosphate oxidase superfamily)
VSAREDLGAVARAIIDGNRYVVLGTADADGRPWVSPVYYAPSGYAELYWVSSPEANHSRNLAGRPELSIVVFDSRVAVGEGQGVYMSAVAQELTVADLERGIEIFSHVSESHGAKPWALDDVRPPAPYRLYRARVSEHWVLDPESHPNQRTSVRLY